MDNILFSSWETLGRTAIVGLLAYFSLVLILRIVGNRSLSQLNAFDLVVTVAIGSTLATVILNKDVSLSEGLFALALLPLLQFVISRLSVRYKRIRGAIKTEPRLLFYRGKYLTAGMKDCRITEEEILQVVRSRGIGTLSDVDAVVLETNGKFSVIKQLGTPDHILRHVKR